MRAVVSLLLVGAVQSIAAASPPDLLTIPEATQYTQTSTYADVVSFITKAAQLSPRLRITTLTTSTEGREIPLVIASGKGVASAAEARLYQLPTVLLVANIHAGEVEGKEALQLLLRDIAANHLDGVLDNQVILLVPVFNVDGNDKLGDNRGDNGPERAGVRYNGQHLDLNRDFVKLDTPEVTALTALINRWEPILFLDMHTTDGSFHREPVTYTTVSHPNASARITSYMWQRMFPQVSRTLREQWGYDSIPYGNFTDRADPTKGWSNHAFDARYSTNMVGLRGCFTILNENYSHAPFPTRVQAAYGFVRSVLEYTHAHLEEMQSLLREESVMVREELRAQGWVSEFEVVELQQITVKGFELEVTRIPDDELDAYPSWFQGVLVTKTEQPRNYTIPYFNRTVARQTISLPDAYLIPVAHRSVITTLLRHGLTVSQLGAPARLNVEEYRISSVSLAQRPQQGRVPLEVEGSYERVEKTLEKGTYLVNLNQPLARLLPVLLEPSSTDSLLRWGYFNAWIFRQWQPELNPCPVLRLPDQPNDLVLADLAPLYEP